MRRRQDHEGPAGVWHEQRRPRLVVRRSPGVPQRAGSKCHTCYSLGARYGFHVNPSTRPQYRYWRTHTPQGEGARRGTRCQGLVDVEAEGVLCTWKPGEAGARYGPTVCRRTRPPGSATPSVHTTPSSASACAWEQASDGSLHAKVGRGRPSAPSTRHAPGRIGHRARCCPTGPPNQ